MVRPFATIIVPQQICYPGVKPGSRLVSARLRLGRQKYAKISWVSVVFLGDLKKQRGKGLHGNFWMWWKSKSKCQEMSRIKLPQDLFRILSQDDLIFWISCSFTVLQAQDDLAKAGLDQALHFQKRGVWYDPSLALCIKTRLFLMILMGSTFSTWSHIDGEPCHHLQWEISEWMALRSFSPNNNNVKAVVSLLIPKTKNFRPIWNTLPDTPVQYRI